MTYRLLILKLLFLALFAQYARCALRFVWEIFRHGARAPQGLDKHNKDVFGEHWESPGELTPIGMRMLYLLGQRNRLRFNNFLSHSFKAEEVYVRSSDYNRTIMSAQSQLLGLYLPQAGALLKPEQIKIAIPPTNDHNFKETQENLKNYPLPGNEQVFPIHLWVKQNPMHFFFYYPYTDSCPALKKVFSKNAKIIIDWFDEFEKKWGPRLRQVLGIKNKNHYSIRNYRKVYELMDHFISDYTEGRKLEILTEAGIDFVEFNNTAYEFSYNDILYNLNGVDGDQTFATISMSILLPEVLDWMQNRIDADISGNEGNKNYKLPKFALFSTHDKTLGSALSFLNPLFNMKPYYYAPFASSLFFELYRNDEIDGAIKADDYTVKIIYNDHEMANVAYPEFKTKLSGALWTSDHISEFCGLGRPKALSLALLKQQQDQI